MWLTLCYTYSRYEQEIDMTPKSLMAAFGIVVMTALSAQACERHSEHAMSCAEGTSWDSETETCTPLTSS